MKKLLFILFLFWGFVGFGQTPELIKDINSASLGFSSDYKNFAKLNNTLYFTLDDKIHGSELWKSDGTAAGTVMVKDIYVGKNSGVDSKIVVLNSKVYFAASDGIHGIELWQSDGTANGTIMVKDFASALNPSDLTVVNGIIYFSSQAASNGIEPWRSDGTEAGTYQLKDVNPGGQDSNPNNFTDVNGTLFFTANGDQIWKSDGTEAGTVLVKDIDINSNSSSISDLTSANGLLFFTQNNYGYGGKLWKSNGTAIGTVPMMSSNSSFLAKNLRNLNNMLVFSGNDGNNRSINPNCHDWQPWKSDGTDVGTLLIKDVFTYLVPNTTEVSGSFPESLTIVGNTLYFTAFDNLVAGFQYAIWKSDGTEAGTVLVKRMADNNQGQRPSNLTATNSNLFFTNRDNTIGVEVWKSDGTNAGTILTKDINAGSGDGIDIFYPRILGINNTLFFVANDNISGFELWKSDGTNAGTVLVKDNIKGSPDGNPKYLTNLNGTLYFHAINMDIPGSASQTGLWKSDGTNAGTISVSQGDAFNLVNVNNTLFFARYNGTLSRPSLWKSDGTAIGTVEVKNNVKVLVSDFTKEKSHFYNFNGTLFFIGDNSTGELDPNNKGYELWKSDGTNAGTVLVKDVNTGVYGAFNNTFSPNFFAINGVLYFTAQTNANGIEIWKTDGTTAGTTLLKDIYVGLENGVYANNPYFTNLGGTLYFLATDGGINNTQLWKTDGTTAGTVMVSNPTNHAYSYTSLVNVNGTLFLSDGNGNIWKSDGTALGTVLVKNGFNGTALYLTNVNNTLFFFGATSSNGRELWKSDGTALGTVLVKDIFIGANSSITDTENIHTPISQNSKLYFSAKNSNNGYELWESDGTEVGTVGYDIFGEENSSFSKDFTPINSTFFFTAVNEKGRELWKLSPCTTNPSPATSSGLTISVGTAASLYATCPTENTIVKWYNQASGGSLLYTGSTFTTPILYDNTTYYVACESGACVSTRTSVLVTVTVLPPAQPGNFTASTASVCQGAIGVVYTVPNVSGITYNWSYSGTGATINGSGNSITVDFANNATSGNLSVTATNSAGTSAARTLTITVTASPSAPTASGVTINAGATASLTATGCTTYKWYDQSTGGTLLQSAATAGFTTPNLYANTTYYVACESGTCVSTRTPVLVTVTVLPPAQPGNFTVSTASVCQGVTSVVYTIPNVNGVTYNWTYSGTGATINGSGNSITIDFANNATSGTLSVTATNSAGTSAARTLAITVTATPSAPTASGVTINAGATASLTATGCTTYKWYDQATGGTLLQSAATAGFTTPNLFANTTYYVACANGTCESGRTSVLVTVTGGSGAILVAHYPFCGNANDATANANNATVSGATLTTDRFGKTNSAYNFNGNEYIEAPSNAALQLGIGDYSFGFWFKTNTSNSPIAMIMKNDANDGYSGLGSYLNYPSVGVIEVRSKNGQAISTNGPSYNDNVWHYVTYTRQGNTQKLYVDNILKATSIGNSPANISNTKPLAFGTFNDGHQQYFMGALDDIKIYSGALSQSEILAEFNSTGGVPTIGSNSPVCAGNTLNLTSTSATSYAWTGVNGFVSTAQNPNITNVSALATGTYMVTVTNAGGCVATATTSVTINTVPPPTANGVTILSGNTASLTATGCSTYKWYSQATGGLATFTGQNFTTPILTSNTNYYVACNAVTSCESARILVVVTVLPCTQMISVKTGSWNDPTVWSCNRIPTATDNITINTGHNVTVPAGTFMVKNVTDKGTLSYALNGILRILGGS
jgi:ELWxxDGT repeat protein